MTVNNIVAVVDEIFDLYATHGAEEYAGENVSQLEHMSQAAQLAMQEGFDDEVVLAAFLHDIGHLLPIHDETESMDGYGMMDHEKAGATYLRGAGFSDKLCRLIASHVNAKRYLTYKTPDYFKNLSAASKKTLECQGGSMEEAEAKQFEDDPLFELYIKMRYWDEAAKVEYLPLPDINFFRSKAIAYLERNQSQ